MKKVLVLTGGGDCPGLNAVIRAVAKRARKEKNWEILEANVVGSFRDRITPCFENTNQEDLLAFLEDSLESDEDVVISNSGRELIFVACKTLVDCLG